MFSKGIFLKCEGFSDAGVASRTKKEYGFPVQLLYRFIKPLKSISDEWLNTICWSSD